MRYFVHHLSSALKPSSRSPHYFRTSFITPSSAVLDSQGSQGSHDGTSRNYTHHPNPHTRRRHPRLTRTRRLARVFTPRRHTRLATAPTRRLRPSTATPTPPTPSTCTSTNHSRRSRTPRNHPRPLASSRREIETDSRLTGKLIARNRRTANTTRSFREAGEDGCEACGGRAGAEEVGGGCYDGVEGVYFLLGTRAVNCSRISQFLISFEFGFGGGIGQRERKGNVP
jgi:hypothetical protein